MREPVVLHWYFPVHKGIEGLCDGLQEFLKHYMAGGYELHSITNIRPGEVAVILTRDIKLRNME